MKVKAIPNPLIIFISILLFVPGVCKSQLTRGNDTTYYVFFPGSITARMFSSQKYNALSLRSRGVKDLHYIPNTNLNLGVGVTYHNLSVNLAYGFGLTKTDQKGKTKYLDLQAHIYKPKWVTDFYGEFYKGYYVYPKGYASPVGRAYYYRPDLKLNLFGLALHHIFNSQRFSYRAAFLQNEWQKRSAGTFLAGIEAYYGIIRGDSSLVPARLEEDFTQRNVQKINYISFGPGIGYAYTQVLFKHFFITASLTGNLNVSYTTEHNQNQKAAHFSLNPATQIRAAAGYNGQRWTVSGTWVNNNLPFRGSTNENKYILSTGNYRFTIARRFMPGKKLEKRLRVIDKVARE